MSVLVGVDAGASHTEAVSAVDGRTLGRSRGAAGALRPGRAREAVRRWMESVHGALRGADAGPPSAVVVGAAGAGHDAARAVAEGLLHEALGSATRSLVVADGEIALEAAFPDGGWGIVVTAGSGSNAFARDPEGGIRRVGGLGWQFGDEGSGYALARDALVAAARALEGRGPRTSLGERLAAQLPCETAEQLLPWARGAAPREIAALARTVVETAAAGDGVAIALVERAAADLARHVEALLPHFEGGDPVPVAFNGGLLHPESAVRNALLGLLRKGNSRLVLVEASLDPPMGALRLARRLL
jgi:N-acetylglucosamine kinase-like BadF-type ATPase